MMVLRNLAALVVCLLLLGVSTASAKETWRSVQSKNFLVVGNGSEKDLQKLAVKLEQFRHVLGVILNKAQLVTPVPTTVVLFKDQESFHDYAPLYKGKTRDNVAGYFIPSSDGNYIALFAGAEQGSRSSVIFHEYTHFVINNNLPRPPVWLNEGLAEFYSSFDTREDGQKALIGQLIDEHVQRLREKTLFPLAELFQVNRKSPQYNEGSRAGLFYAQSWALIHYLMLGNNGKRQPQLVQFLGRLNSNVPLEQLFRESFQTDYRGMEEELRQYAHLFTFPYVTYSFKSELDFTRETTLRTLSDAEAKVVLGDLLLMQRRYPEAQAHFAEALQRDPNLASAHYSMGRLHLLQDKDSEAQKCFENAVSKNPQSHMAHFQLARLLLQTGKPEPALAAFHKALEINPNVPNLQYSFGLFQKALGNEEKAIEAFKKSLSLAPLNFLPLRVLSNLHLQRAEGNLAAIYGATYVQRQGWDDESAPYMALTAHFGYRQVQRMVPAANILNEALTNLKPGDWPVPVFKYLKKEITAAELLKQAKDNDQLTEAHAYVGLDLSLNGETAVAVEHLEWVRDHGTKTFVEYEFAVAELKRLYQKKTETGKSSQ